MHTPDEVLGILSEQHTKTVIADVELRDLEETLTHLETLRVGDGQPFYSEESKRRDIDRIRSRAKNAYHVSWRGSMRIPVGITIDEQVVVQGDSGFLNDIDFQPIAYYVRLQDWDRRFATHPQDCEQSMLVFTI